LRLRQQSAFHLAHVLWETSSKSSVELVEPGHRLAGEDQ
jgi:hypothetical protein